MIKNDSDSCFVSETNDSFLKRMISFLERMNCFARGGFVSVAVRVPPIDRVCIALRICS